jgi:hypothetical protein
LTRPISETPVQLSGPARKPAQLLGDQEYSGHSSIHDGDVAAGLGFAAGAIEGPVHLSQFDPLLLTLWPDQWFAAGCVSVHYSAPCVEGEEVRAFAEAPHLGATTARIWMEKADGTLVLTGSATVAGDFESTEARGRLSRLRPPGPLQILDQISAGDQVTPARVRMDYDRQLGQLYPFTLRDKLDVITEPLSYYESDSAGDSPWDGPVIPMEMVSVLCQHVPNGLPTREPSVGLFIDQEIRLHNGPVLVATDYDLERTVIALGESRRTESYWLESRLLQAGSGQLVATALLHVGMFKDSYPDYVYS